MPDDPMQRQSQLHDQQLHALTPLHQQKMALAPLMQHRASMHQLHQLRHSLSLLSPHQPQAQARDAP